jgi:hypothetical protein
LTVTTDGVSHHDLEGVPNEAQRGQHHHHPCRQSAPPGRCRADTVRLSRREAGRSEHRVREAVAEVVERQEKIGIDVISDGEIGKVGFSNYVLQRMSGFAGHAQFMAADLADAPEIAAEALGSVGSQHMRLPILSGPIEARDPGAVQHEIDDFSAALNGHPRDDAFIPAVTPGHVAFNFPTSTSRRRRAP